MEIVSFNQHMKPIFETMINCMEKAIEEEPDASKNWTPEQLFEKGANYAGRHVMITEKKSPTQHSSEESPSVS